MRQFNADELEPFSRAGLEALLMEIQDDFRLRKGEDQLYSQPHAPVLMARTTELGVLSPIADHATADYAAILDRGNLNDVKVLKELVRKSVVPALHYTNTNIF